MANRPVLLVFQTSQSVLDMAPYDPAALPRFSFVGRIGGGEVFRARALGRLPFVRSSPSLLLSAARARFNYPWAEVEESIERRERLCVEPGLLPPSCGKVSPPGLPSGTSKSSAAYTIIE